MRCANLWSDLIIFFHVRMAWIVAKFGQWHYKLLVKWVGGPGEALASLQSFKNQWKQIKKRQHQEKQTSQACFTKDIKTSKSEFYENLWRLLFGYMKLNILKFCTCIDSTSVMTWANLSGNKILFCKVTGKYSHKIQREIWWAIVKRAPTQVSLGHYQANGNCWLDYIKCISFQSINYGQISIRQNMPKTLLSIYRLPWWLHYMETFSVLLALYEGNPLVTSGFPSQRASNVELWCFLWFAPEQMVGQTRNCRSVISNLLGYPRPSEEG